MSNYRLEPVVSTLRIYDKEDPTYDDHSVAEMTVQHILPGVWSISAHRGEHTRNSMRSLLQVLIENNVHTVIADRSPGKGLPGGVPRADGVGLEIDVESLAKKLHHKI